MFAMSFRWLLNDMFLGFGTGMFGNFRNQTDHESSESCDGWSCDVGSQSKACMKCCGVESV